MRVELEFLTMPRASSCGAFIQLIRRRQGERHHIITSSNDDLLIKNYVTRVPSLSLDARARALSTPANERVNLPPNRQHIPRVHR
jgi:hypothetical protein